MPRQQVTCWCDAYDFPHQLHSGRCGSRLDETCPSCDAIVGDAVTCRNIPGWGLEPPEQDIIIAHCPKCGANGVY